MKSFPNTLNRGGKTIQNGVVNSTRMQTYTNALNYNRVNPLDTTVLYSVDRDVDALLKSKMSALRSMTTSQKLDIVMTLKQLYSHLSLMTKSATETNDTIVEDALKISYLEIDEMNTYKRPFKESIRVKLDSGVTFSGEIKEKDNSTLNFTTHVYIPATLSLFNKYHFIQVSGYANNVPLLNTSEININNNTFNTSTTEDVEYGTSTSISTISSTDAIKRATTADTSDCSIRKLVELSRNGGYDSLKGDHTAWENNELGHAKYKYADFMYCKDLGLISNNYLITLRKFDHPIGDDIFSTASYKYNTEIGDDTARMVTWFGTEDNKIENILHYSVEATWRGLTSKIEEKSSTSEGDEGFLSSLSHTMNKNFFQNQKDGFTGSSNLFAYAGKKLGINFLLKQGNYKDTETYLAAYGHQYDGNKVYEPLNTIRDTHIYDGLLKYTQDITIVFRYTLRAYDNINPKAAFLDLLGNINEMTYRHGRFWGGSRRLIGPTQNQTPFNVSKAFINKGANSLSTFFSSIVNIGGSVDNILGLLTTSLENLWKDASLGIIGLGKSLWGATTDIFNIKNTDSKISAATQVFGGIIKGIGYQFQNYLGRPLLYAWQSLLSGSDVGLWHLTIGNPRNPIATIGNLIMTKADVELSGPLGIDDFPTELKVTVHLTPGRSRDIGDIERMYTKGQGAIWYDLASLMDISKIFGSNSKEEYPNAYLFEEKSSDYGAKNDMSNVTTSASTSKKK